MSGWEKRQGVLGLMLVTFFLGFALSLSGELLVSDRCVWDRMGME